MFVMGVVLGCAASAIVVVMESSVEFSRHPILFAVFTFLLGFTGKKDKDKKPSFFAGNISGYLLGVTVVALLAYWKIGMRYGFIVFALEVSFIFGIWLREEIDSRKREQGGESGTAR